MFTSINEWFSYFLEYSIYAAIIALIVIGIRALIIKKLPAAIVYALWGIVLVRLLLPLPLPLPSIIDTSSLTEATQTVQEQSPNANFGQATYPNVPATQNGAVNPQITVPEQHSNTTATENSKTLAFNWALLPGIIWMLGFAALLFYSLFMHILMARKFRSKVRMNCNSLLRKCAALAGVKYINDVYISDLFDVPVLFGLFNPTIILPLSARAMSEEELEHIILHELSHKKRGDMWVKMLSSLALFINWFNPVLWLSHFLANRDMERACDARVIRLLGLGKRKSYAESLLTVSLSINRAITPYGVLTFAESGVKQRISSVLSIKKYSKLVTAFSLALIIVFSVFVLAACQPTPEKPVVVNKGDGKLEEVLGDSASPQEMFSAPSQYKLDKQSYYNDMLSVAFDMQVQTPDVSAYPIYGLIDQDFSQAQVNRIVTALMHDKPLIYYDEQQTKQELTDQFLLPEKKRLAEAKSGKSFSDDGGNVSIEQIEENIRMFEEWIRNAPETKDEHSVTADDYTKTGTLSAQADLGGTKIATLNIVRKGQSFYFLKFVNGTEYIYNGFFDPTDDLPMKTTKKQAIEQAEKLISEMGADDFQLAAVGKTTRLGSEEQISSDQHQNTVAYSVVFTRTIDGIQTAYTPIDSISGDEVKEKMDAETWSYERIMINIDDSGIANVYWNGHVQISDPINKNVKLTDFDDVATRAMDQIKVQNAYLANQGKDAGRDSEGRLTVKLDINITRAILGYMRVRQKDTSEYILLPVWDFYGTTTYHYSDSRPPEVNNNGFMAIVTINAIDGSVVDRKLGY